MVDSKATSPRHSAKLLIGLGVLWLFLALGHLFYQVANPTVEITWDTATELQTAGFNLYRRDRPVGDFVLVNQEMIPSQGEALSGAAYNYIDDTVESGKTYYYVLEEVEYNLATNRYEEDLFAFTVPYVTWWTAVITAVSLLVGLALIVTGLREDKNL